MRRADPRGRNRVVPTSTRERHDDHRCLGFAWPLEQTALERRLDAVRERPHRVDRVLMQLRAAGCSDGTRALVIEERRGSLGVSVFVNAPFGHGASCAPIALGANASIDVHGTVRFDPELCYDPAPRRTP